MRSFVSIRIVIPLTAVLGLCSLGCQAKDNFVPGEILVRVKSGQEASFETAAKAQGLSVRKTIKEIRFRLMKLPKRLSVEEAVAKIKANPSVEYAGPNHIFRLAADQTWPNDPVFYDGYDILDLGIFIAPPQWGLYNDGINASAYYTTLPGKFRADIHAPEAWTITTGSPSIVIASIDTGVDHTHPDLLGNVILPGYNAINGSTNAMDDNGHGTFTAGIFSANMDNYEGIASVAPDCPILPVKAIDASGYGTEADAADGLVWAVDHGAKVLNMSFATDIDEPALEAAIDYAWQQGCISICASGNENVGTPMYPAAYANAVAVGASNEWDERCTASDWGIGGSNYGPYLDVSAPGNEITSAWSDPTLGQIYFSAPGTSAAAPFVAGTAALVWSIHPDWTNQKVVDQVVKTADDIESPGWDQYSGWGRLNAYRALTETLGVTQSIGQLAGMPDGAYVEMQSKVITAGSGQITNIAYIEEEDRSAGIRVEYPSGVPSGLVPGDRVDVVASLGTVEGERALVGAVLTEVSADAALRPVGITNQRAAGVAAKLTRGLFVRVWGRVTEVGWDNIYIDDGSGLDDGISAVGLRVAVPSPSADWEGKMALITGVVGMDLPSGAAAPVPVVRPRKPSDIRILQ